MERLTIPDERIDERTTRRKIIDGEKVREHAMEIYWQLKKYEDTGLSPEAINDLMNDLHALMWCGDGCEICAHKIVDERAPYRRLRCGLGSSEKCNPLWHGLKHEKETEA